MSVRPRRKLKTGLDLEALDPRQLLSTLTPGQLSHAYGFDNFSFYKSGQYIKADGAGQTIALVEAYHNPYLFSDVAKFNSQFGLPAVNMTQAWYGTTPNDGWATEEVMDVELVHALAPGARILVVEARSNSTADLLTAVNYARSQPGVSVVSMSWGSNEFAGEQSYDGYFTTPAGHNGVTFFASSGDHGAWPGVSWPAASPNVVSVGGTRLNTDSYGNYLSETGWNNGADSRGTIWATGGGYSRYESEPSYQYGVQRSGRRTVPDVAMNADPNSGMYFYNTAPSSGRGAWYSAGGTSASAPEWAALMAIANQGRALNGRGSLDGARQTLPALYSPAMNGDFHDVTSGFNGYYAGHGYDLVAGRGTPIALNVVRDLMYVSSSFSAFASAASPGFGLGGLPSAAMPFTSDASPVLDKPTAAPTIQPQSSLLVQSPAEGSLLVVQAPPRVSEVQVGLTPVKNGPTTAYKTGRRDPFGLLAG